MRTLRFNKQVARRSLKRLGGRTWFWGVMGEGAVREMGWRQAPVVQFGYAFYRSLNLYCG